MSEVLVIGLDGATTQEQVEEIHDFMTSHLPGVDVLLIAGASGMAVVHPRRPHDPIPVSSPSESG